jgi:hypothetical protein
MEAAHRRFMVDSASTQTGNYHRKGSENMTMDHDFGPAQDAREQLRRWDGGGVIWSIEMGGLGPGYEQAIQLLAIEIVRDEIDRTPATEPPRDWGDATVSRLNDSCGGFSGAQVGVAKFLAHKWLTIGPAALLNKIKERHRHIQVSRFWPHAPKVEHVAS